MTTTLKTEKKLFSLSQLSFIMTAKQKEQLTHSLQQKFPPISQFLPSSWLKIQQGNTEAMSVNNELSPVLREKFSTRSQATEETINKYNLIQLLALNTLNLSNLVPSIYIPNLNERNCPSTPTENESQNPCQQPQDQQLNNSNIENIKVSRPFTQLSGHPNSLAPASPLTLWKQCIDSREVQLYDLITKNVGDPMYNWVPKYISKIEWGGELFIELEDLTIRFPGCNSSLMDIKMGTRTFHESEVGNAKLRTDLYEKMLKLDPLALTPTEHSQKAITKLRYMQFREQQSSTSNFGFRIEAIKYPSLDQPNKYTTLHDLTEITNLLQGFLTNNELRLNLIKKLSELRVSLESSPIFQSHSIIGSSLLILHDNESNVGVWMIDFAKSDKCTVPIDHRSPWVMGNCEDGYLFGLDSLINLLVGIGCESKLS